jgi:NADH:ubiquinone oxidoreductase subunit F (NADH-binding)
MSLAGDSLLPRLLERIPSEGAMSLEEHVAVHGRSPAGSRRERRGAPSLLETIERAGLLGRGGAAFPTAVKLRAVAGARGRAIVVANGTEGEPTSFKDRVLLEGLPHLVIDGGVLAALAIGADELILCVSESAREAHGSLAQAVEERSRTQGDSVTLRLEAVPEGYVSGQESALVSFLDGGPAKPTFVPPMPFERGVHRRPTLVDNVETLAHIALIARYGPGWFRELGSDAHSGSTLLTLSGAVAHPGVYEVDPGASLESLVAAAGGATGSIRAVLIGGYAGSWLNGPSLSHLTLSHEQLARRGASLGAGIVLLLPDEACVVAETTRVARWMAQQSAGQCGSCVNGLNAVATAMEQIAAGVAPAGTGTRLARWASLARHRGACRHPDGAVRFVLSTLDIFAEEFSDHARHGPCDGCSAAGWLPVGAAALERGTVV